MVCNWWDVCHPSRVGQLVALEVVGRCLMMLGAVVFVVGCVHSAAAPMVASALVVFGLWRPSSARMVSLVGARLARGHLMRVVACV